MKLIWLACAVAAVASGGPGAKRARSDEHAAVCTENTEGQLDTSGRCRCECYTGPEGGGPCAFYTRKDHLHGAGDWCPKDLGAPSAPAKAVPDVLVRLVLSGTPPAKKSASQVTVAVLRAPSAEVDSATPGDVLIQVTASGPVRACVRHAYQGATVLPAHLEVAGQVASWKVAWAPTSSGSKCWQLRRAVAGSVVRLVLDGPLAPPQGPALVGHVLRVDLLLEDEL